MKSSSLKSIKQEIGRKYDTLTRSELKNWVLDNFPIKKRGRKALTPSLIDNRYASVLDLVKKGIGIKKAIQEVNIPENVFYKYLKDHQRKELKLEKNKASEKKRKLIAENKKKTANKRFKRSKLTNDEITINFNKAIAYIQDGLNITEAIKKIGLSAGVFYNHLTKDQISRLKSEKRIYISKKNNSF